MQHLTYLLLGLGSGAVIAALGLGLVVTQRASRVVNLAHAAAGMYVAVAYYELRATGELVLPLLGLPSRVSIIDRPTVTTALVVCIVLALALGAILYLTVFRWLRTSHPLARLVASLGLLLYFISIVGLRLPNQGTSTLNLDGPLPSRLISLGDVRAPLDRYLLAGLVVVAAGVLSLLYRFTRLGLATRASAENERGAVLLGISPHAIGVVNWALATVLGAMALILAAPSIRLDPGTTSLLVVPAVAAALVGRLRAIWPTVFAGLAIGMLQSELLNLQTEWDWLPDIGLQQGVPFVLILATLGLRRDLGFERRGVTQHTHLPPATDPRLAVPVTVALGIGAVVAVMLTDGSWRLGITISAIASLFALSIVVITGLVGQISLATYALAGLAAFAMVRFADDAGLGFPLAPAAGVLVAAIVATITSLPALRVRGESLAIATLAASVAVEEFVFKWSWFTGGLGGSTVERPEIGGIDLGIGAVGDAYPRQQFAILCIVILVTAVVCVTGIRRGQTGRRWLAVRANERAASALGIGVTESKVTAFALAGLLAGLAGTLLAYQRQIVSVSSFGVLSSIVALAFTYLAGIAVPVASLLAGGMASGGLLTVALDQISDSASSYQFAVNGLLLVVAAVRFPDGIVGRRSRSSASTQSPPDERPHGH